MVMEEDEDPYANDMVIIRQPQNPRDPHVVTINCPNKTGLGCDFCRVFLCFGVSIVKGDASTDGKWCFIVFWVVGNRETRWGLLKKRLLQACPSIYEGLFGYNFSEMDRPKQPQVFFLKLWCSDRLGLLLDLTRVLCDLELTIRKMKVSTTPDGRVVDLFFVTDNRELLHTKRRREDISCKLHDVLGEAITKCEIEQASAEIVTCLEASSFQPPVLDQKNFSPELSDDPLHGSLPSPNNVHVTMDNSLSSSHTLIQISCRHQKGLLYIILRTLKDLNIQLSYGRFFANPHGGCETDLFVMQPDGKKIVEPCKQEALCSRFRSDLLSSLRVTLVNRGPDLELLVANVVEVSGKGRPLVFHDIALALKSLHARIFMAEIGRHMVGDREWEVYRILLNDGCEFSVNKNMIEDCVMKTLMGWER